MEKFSVFLMMKKVKPDHKHKNLLKYIQNQHTRKTWPKWAEI